MRSSIAVVVVVVLPVVVVGSNKYSNIRSEIVAVVVLEVLIVV